MVLFFYRGAWCPLCTLQMSDLRLHYREFEKLGARIVAVSTDPPGVARAYKAMMRLPFTVVSDPGREAIEAYGATEGTNIIDRIDRAIHPAVGIRDYAQTATFVVDTRGAIRYARVGADPFDRPAATQLLNVLRGLGQAEKRARSSSAAGRPRRPGPAKRARGGSPRSSRR